MILLIYIYDYDLRKISPQHTQIFDVVFGWKQLSCAVVTVETVTTHFFIIDHVYD